MDKKQIAIIGVLVVIIAILACLLTYQTILQEEPDNVITLDGITFNTSSNITDFKENKSSSEHMSNQYLNCHMYLSNNGTEKYSVTIVDYSTLNDYGSGSYIDEEVKNGIMGSYKNCPYQVINGVVVYAYQGTSGNGVGKLLYHSVVQNSDEDKIIIFATPDQNETAKMASSLKFN